MININFIINQNNQIIGFKISGHSGYAENGKDIVCSAVSSAVYMAINTITDILSIKCYTSVDSKHGRITFKINNNNDIPQCQDILKGLKLHLSSLCKLYSENININYMEV